MTWLRLEGATRDPELAEGLAAHVADPLWTLARQWQVGEFHGEDAASPVMVTAQVAHTPLTVFAAGGEDGGGRIVQRATADRPLEVLVEQEAVGDDAALALELGWMLLRALADAGAPATLRRRLRDAHAPVLPVDDGLDAGARARLEIAARRSLDGRALERALAAAGGTAAYVASLGLPAAPAGVLKRVLDDWIDVASSFVREPAAGSSWQPSDVEYGFRVAAPTAEGELALAAAGYRGGTLDWYHFRRRSEGAALGAEGTPDVRTITVLPTPLRFHGMPAARFWEIEDHAVSFGDLAGGEEDLVRAIVGGFAATYGEDWFIVPCVLRAGTLARVQSLVVQDDYGRRVAVPAAAVLDGPGRMWRFFELADDDGPDAPDPKDRRAPLLLLAPVLPDTEEGPPLERVDLVRDSLSNLAWGIERKAVGAAGSPIDRDMRARPAAETAGAAEGWRYEAFRPPPENWIPFVPVRIGDGAQVHLRRGRMAVADPDVPPARLLPMGRILDASRPLRIHEAAIPDAGLRIDRRYQRARGPDGRVHLWVGRRVRLGAQTPRGRFVTDHVCEFAP